MGFSIVEISRHGWGAAMYLLLRLRLLAFILIIISWLCMYMSPSLARPSEIRPLASLAVTVMLHFRKIERWQLSLWCMTSAFVFLLCTSYVMFSHVFSFSYFLLPT